MSGREGERSRAFSPFHVELRRHKLGSRGTVNGKQCWWRDEPTYRVSHLLSELGWVDLDLGRFLLPLLYLMPRHVPRQDDGPAQI